MIRYAPHIDGTIPAFSNDGLIVPFQHNPAVPLDETGKPAAEAMVLKVKDLNGNTIGYLKATEFDVKEVKFKPVCNLKKIEDNGDVNNDGVINVLDSQQLFWQIINNSNISDNKNLDFNNDGNTDIKDTTVLQDYGYKTLVAFNPGQYYKIQLAYSDTNENIEYNDLAYSSVGVTKYIGDVVHGYNFEAEKVIFTFTCPDDPTETIFKEETKVTSGGVEIKNDILRKGFTYTITNAVTTANGYYSEETVTIDSNSDNNKNDTSNLPIVKPTLNYEYGEVDLTTLGDKTCRYFIRVNSLDDENYSIVNSPDNTVEHGKSYYYGVMDEQGNWLLNTTPVTPYFEDMFLQDGRNSLRIKFNPKVSSFKRNIQESKQDTLGGQYPYFFRNGDMNYAEFPISGLLSYWMGEHGKFGYDWDYGLVRAFEGKRGEDGVVSAAAAKNATSSLMAMPFEEGSLNAHDVTDRHTRTTNLEDYNITAERRFKMKVYEWLTNGQPKLFRSPTEGNFVVRLMNVSLSPEERLGRMLHTFNATAYECSNKVSDAYGDGVVINNVIKSLEAGLTIQDLDNIYIRRDDDIIQGLNDTYIRRDEDIIIQGELE